MSTGGAEAGGQGPQSAPQEWYVGKPIKDFTFTGLITIKAEDLRAIVAPYIGQSFSVDPLLWEIEGKLYALDYFETIVPNALPADDAKSAVIIQFERLFQVRDGFRGFAQARESQAERSIRRQHLRIESECGAQVGHAFLGLFQPHQAVARHEV